MSLDFLQDDSKDETGTTDIGNPWKIAVIDDAPDVHETTRLVLGGYHFENRAIELLHAISAAEGRELFEQHPDIAVALIDVVMETDRAGLDLVDWVRHSHDDHLVRLLLRTGQPGYAPQMEVIVDYDIDDYKEKSELTRTGLITAVVTGLRSYRRLLTIDRNRRSLHRLIESLGDLFTEHAVREFAASILMQLASLLEVEPEGIVCAVDGHDAAGGTVRIIASAGSLEALTGQSLDALPDAQQRELVRQCIDKGENILDNHGTALALFTPAGDRGAVFIHMSAQQIRESGLDDLIRLFAINASVGYRNAALFEHVQQLAYVDQATGLPSYSAFQERFDRAATQNEPLIIILARVHGFGAIVHGVGEERAMEFLYEVGRRLWLGLTAAHLVARREGAEFVLMVPAKAIQMPNRFAHEVIGMFDHPVIIGETTLRARLRLGIAEFPAHGEDARALVRHAGIALSELRRRGYGSWLMFDPGMLSEARERMRLASLLTDHSSRTSFLVHYQPIVQAVSGRISGAEALLRFATETGEVLHTADMVDAAEANGLIGELGAWVLREAMRVHTELPCVHEDWRLNVNVSPVQIQDGRIYHDYQTAIEETGFDPRNLTVEVTESILVENEHETIAFLQQLRNEGVKVMIDDFGTGYSSLSYLSRLPIDGLKIDRSFVMNMDSAPDAEAVVGSIVALARCLGLETTAEGVETESQRQQLATLGVDRIQGYLVSEALPSDRFAQFIRDTVSR